MAKDEELALSAALIISKTSEENARLLAWTVGKTLSDAYEVIKLCLVRQFDGLHIYAYCICYCF